MHIKIKKGLNIPMQGVANLASPIKVESDVYALRPDEFKGIQAKVLVQEGDQVQVGTPIFRDKVNELIKVVSPVSGSVKSIVRGEKRKLLAILISSNHKHETIQHPIPELSSLDRMGVIKVMLDAGLWPMMLQRPYAIIANPAKKPKSIFVSAFDSAPLAPNPIELTLGKDQFISKGLEVLKKLTEGKVHVNFHHEQAKPSYIKEDNQLQLNTFSGPHPSSTIGVQIHHLDPIDKGDVVWYIGWQELAMIGQFFVEGIYVPEKTIALTGKGVLEKDRIAFKVISGIQINAIINNRISDFPIRYISGNVLTGTNVGVDGHMGFYDNQLMLIPEVSEPELLGWAGLGLTKYSASKSFLSKLLPNKKFSFNTNTYGGLRAFVMSNDYDKVLPMDVLPVHLLKAIIIKDIDLMEQLGIYEVAEEEFALCDYVCTSKQECQAIIREGLDFIRKELGE